MILQCNQLQTPYRKCLEFRNRMLKQKRCLTNNKYWNNQMTSSMYQNQASGAGRSGQTASRRSVLFHTASTTNQHIIVLMKHQSKARWCTKEPFTNGKLHATKVSPHTHTFPERSLVKTAHPPPTTARAPKAVMFRWKCNGTRFKETKYTRSDTELLKFY